MILTSIRRRFKKTTAHYNAVIVWGAGKSGENALALLHGSVSYVVDSFSDRTELMGLAVKRPDVLKEETGSVLVIIASVAFRDIQKWVTDETPDVEAVELSAFLARESRETGEFGKLIFDLAQYFDTSWFHTIVTQPQLFVNVSFRFCRALLTCELTIARLVLYPARILHAFMCVFFGIDLPITVSAGPGLQFLHFGTIVFHERTQVGAFCRIYQGVTIGSDKHGNVPRLHDFVYLWSNAIIFGDVVLGDYSQVGANSTCFGPLEVHGASVVGSPAQIIEKP